MPSGRTYKKRARMMRDGIKIVPELVDRPATKKCTRCTKVKSIDEFYFNHSQDRYDSWCKVCKKGERKEAYQNSQLKLVGQIALNESNTGLSESNERTTS